MKVHRIFTMLAAVSMTVPALACDTCVLWTQTPFPFPVGGGKYIKRSIAYWNRCVDFDNVPPGHCCIVPVVNSNYVKNGQVVGVYSRSFCNSSTPTDVECGSPTSPPYMANPVHIDQGIYWQNYSPVSPFSLVARPGSKKKADCKCDVPEKK